TILGDAHSMLGDYVQACAAYREAVELDPAHLTAPLGLGWAYERLDQIDNAVGAYREALRRNPTNEAVLHALVNLLTRLGFHDLAAETLAQHTQSPEDVSSGQ